LKNDFLLAIVSSPAPGYMFGRGIYCSDAAAKETQCVFHGLEKPQGFLVLAVASLGDKLIEMSKFQRNTVCIPWLGKTTRVSCTCRGIVER